MIFLDTNLLIYAHRSATPEHSAARSAIERASESPRGCGIALPSIAEFFSIVTHPAALGDGGATEIWTHDHNFVPVPGLIVFDPLVTT